MYNSFFSSANGRPSFRLDQEVGAYHQRAEVLRVPLDDGAGLLSLWLRKLGAHFIACAFSPSLGLLCVACCGLAEQQCSQCR
jgi:hypothetical protein